MAVNTRFLADNKLVNSLIQDIKVSHSSTIKGVGDDAAILDLHGSSTVMATNTFTEAVSFDLAYTPLNLLGYKVVVAGVSNILAMNAQPTHLMLSLGVPQRINEKGLLEFYEGVKQACENYHLDLVGGDTKGSMAGFVITTTALGMNKIDKLSYRSNAQEKDLIVVSGDLGAAYAGLDILQAKKKEFNATQEQPDISDYKYLVERQLKPEARRDVVHFLAENNIVPTSMTDITNGLRHDLIKLLDRSALGAELYEKQLPVSVDAGKYAEAVKEPLLNFVLNGGEDYELLFTVGLDQADMVKDVEGLSIIGYTRPISEGVKLICKNERVIELTKQ